MTTKEDTTSLCPDAVSTLIIDQVAAAAAMDAWKNETADNTRHPPYHSSSSSYDIMSSSSRHSPIVAVPIATTTANPPETPKATPTFNSLSTSSASSPVEYVYSMIDQSIICDQYHRPITIGRMLATKPLVTDVLTRPGPGNKKLVYLSGDTITRSLNEIFTYTGWNL